MQTTDWSVGATTVISPFYFFSSVLCLSARSFSFLAVINNHLSAVHAVRGERVVEHKTERESVRKEKLNVSRG